MHCLDTKMSRGSMVDQSWKKGSLNKPMIGPLNFIEPIN